MSQTHFTFAQFSSFSLERKEGESDEDFYDRAQNKAIDLMAQDTSLPVCHESSDPEMID